MDEQEDGRSIDELVLQTISDEVRDDEIEYLLHAWDRGYRLAYNPGVIRFGNFTNKWDFDDVQTYAPFMAGRVRDLSDEQLNMIARLVVQRALGYDTDESDETEEFDDNPYALAAAHVVENRHAEFLVKLEKTHYKRLEDTACPVTTNFGLHNLEYILNAIGNSDFEFPITRLEAESELRANLGMVEAMEYREHGEYLLGQVQSYITKARRPASRELAYLLNELTDYVSGLSYEEPIEMDDVSKSASISSTLSERRDVLRRYERAQRELGWVASAELVRFKDLRQENSIRENAWKHTCIAKRDVTDELRDAEYRKRGTVALAAAYARRRAKLAAMHGYSSKEYRDALEREQLYVPQPRMTCAEPDFSVYLANSSQPSPLSAKQYQNLIIKESSVQHPLWQCNDFFETHERIPRVKNEPIQFPKGAIIPGNPSNRKSTTQLNLFE